MNVIYLINCLINGYTKNNVSKSHRMYTYVYTKVTEYGKHTLNIQNMPTIVIRINPKAKYLSLYVLCLCYRWSGIIMWLLLFNHQRLEHGADWSDRSCCCRWIGPPFVPHLPPVEPRLPHHLPQGLRLPQLWSLQMVKVGWTAHSTDTSCIRTYVHVYAHVSSNAACMDLRTYV